MGIGIGIGIGLAGQQLAKIESQPAQARLRLQPGKLAATTRRYRANQSQKPALEQEQWQDIGRRGRCASQWRDVT